MKPEPFNYLAHNYWELNRTFEHLNEAMAGNQVDYKKYKASPLWKTKAEALLNYTENRCQMCGQFIPWGAQMHHHYYVSNSINVVGHEHINDVAILHAGCHDKIRYGVAPNTCSWVIYPILPTTASAEDW